MNKSVLALVAMASAVVSVPAFAAPASATVRTADLNLASPAGREVLARRISFAAKRVCIVEGDRSLVALIEGHKCYDRAVNSAHSRVASAADSIVIASR
jgi:UrcA family protein